MLVLEAGIAPDYVLDRMECYEIWAILPNLYRKEKGAWERTRMLCYTIAQINSKSKLTPEKIMKFAWETEKKGTDSKPEAPSDAEVARLKATAQYLIDNKLI